MTPELEYLYSLELFGIKLGLDNITALLEAAAQPQRAFPSVHVAGTNGKGSVLAMLDAVLQAAGVRTGRFTSPHLIHVAERFLVNSIPLSEAALDGHIRFFRAIAEELGQSPTFFEMNTAIAFRHFAEERVDAALIETGMGGRFDSTNVLQPVAAAITNVTLEHVAYLGDTREKIAFEKAGIAKPGVPLIVAEEDAGPLNVILDVAEKADAPVRLAGRDFTWSVSGPPLAPRLTYAGPLWEFSDAPLALSGLHQGPNAAVATALAETLQPRFPQITREAVLAGLTRAHWPCRLERVLDDPATYIDVAHNPAGMARLAENLPRCVVLLAVSADKDARTMIEAVRPIAARLVLTQFSNRRALPANAIAAAARAAAPETPVEVEPDLPAAVVCAMELARREALPLAVTGSIFLAGEVRQLLVDDYGAPPMAF